MSQTADLVIRSARLPSSERPVDVAVSDGQIVALESTFEGEASTELDASENLVSPGFVDCHMHLDMAYAAETGPLDWNDKRVDVEQFHTLMDEYFDRQSVAELAANAERAIREAVANGTTHLRTHAMVDSTVGADTMRALLEAHTATEELANVQIVPYASRGILEDRSEPQLREALELGLDAVGSDNVLLGGMEPASRNCDIERTFDRWFALATEYNVDLDVHLQDRGTLGAYTVEQLLDRVRRHGFEGRVTVSHGYCLGDVPTWSARELASQIADVDASLVTCYSSTPYEIPLRTLVEDGLTVGHGTDNTRDFGFPHGTPDPVLGAYVEMFKLHGSPTRDADYRWYETNPGLRFLWRLFTEGGAATLGLDEYGATEGTSANFAVFDEPTPEAAILRRATPRYVIREGRIVARDRTIVV